MFRSVITKVQKSVDLQPLQHLASMRVAISVCETEDMQDMMRTFRKPCRTAAFSENRWKRLHSKARKKLVQIGVPDRIADKILEKLWAVSFEIFKWINYHAEDTGIECSPTFSWTPRFAVDYIKTAEMLTKNETLDIKKRFKLACFYCLESELHSLWRTMSLSERRFFFVRRNLKNFEQNLIVLYWTYYIQKVPIDYWACESLKHKKLFKYSVKNGYLTAAIYFFNKLSVQDRNGKIFKSFDSYIPYIYRPGYILKDHFVIACFLICQLHSATYLDRLGSHLGFIFLYFLEWPWQIHFMNVVNQLRSHISKYTFLQLLQAILEKEMEGFQDHDYKELFMEFWLQGPDHCKIYVNTEKEIGYSMLKGFVEKHFEFIFEEQSFTLKKKFRDIVFEQNVSEDVPTFEPKNVEFFRFLIRAQVATRETIQKYLISHRLANRETFFRPLGELLYLVDGLMGNV